MMGLVLIALGLFVGAAGTLIGAGGGFMLVPVLLLIEPAEKPEVITAVSLVVVFFNAFSGSCAYAGMRRIDYRSGLWFALAAIPGAIAGALTTDYIPRRLFNSVFGMLLLALAAYLFLHREKKPRAEREQTRQGHTARTVVERDGTVHHYSYPFGLGMGLSGVVGYFSSLLGIGGGIIHVPALVRLLNYPVHIATATSHFILAIMALTGTLAHIATGAFTKASAYQAFWLSLGALFGAQLGARLSNYMKGPWIIRGLAGALGLVGLRILLMGLHS